MPIHDRLGVICALIAVGLLAFVALTWPAGGADRNALSSSSGRTLLALVLVCLAWAGAEAVVSNHPKIAARPSNVLPLHWIVPGGLIAAASALLGQAMRMEVKLLGAATSCGLFAFLIAGEYYVVDPQARWHRLVRLALRLATYLVATLLYMAIRLGITAHGTAAAVIGLVSVVLAWRLFTDDERVVRLLRQRLGEHHSLPAASAIPAWLLVPALGALLSLSCWLIDLWAAPPLVQALVLVALLYLGIGLARHFLMSTLTQRITIEYLIVGAAALLLLLFSTR
jgi:hypothetical protein